MVNCVVQKQKNVDSKIYFNGSINFDKMSKVNVHLTKLLQLLRNFVPQISCHDFAPGAVSKKSFIPPIWGIKQINKLLHSGGYAVCMKCHYLPGVSYFNQ